MNKLLIGGTGFVSTFMVGEVLPLDGGQLANVVDIVIKIVIAVATLIGIFRKPKNQG